MTVSSSPQLSLIIPVYNEGGAIAANLREIARIMRENAIPAAYILIDDGSQDNTWEELNTAAAELPEARLIRFSRNFGKEAALCAGLDAVSTPACVILDADLQHPPALIPEMYKLWQSGEYDVIEGVKTSRGGEKWWNRLGAKAFYSLLTRFSGIDLHNASDFKLLDAKIVAAWKRCPEKQTFFRGLAAWVGFRRRALPFAVEERKSGVSHWSFASLFSLAVNGITAFTTLPLQLITVLGVLFLLGAVPIGIEALYMKFTARSGAGFTTVILLILIVGGLLLLSLGIIGTYIARIYEEIKGRPRYLVDEEKEFRSS